MLRASALYIVIVIALVIAILCSSLIVAAYFYKEQYQLKLRYDLLENNNISAQNLILAKTDAEVNERLSLFSENNDSVQIKKFFWGMFDVGISKAFIQKDTLTKVFSIAHQIDSAKWAALYLIDEDRPLSVSGNTEIKGDAYLPKAGIKQAYVDNTAYSGDERLVIGTKHTSDKTLPALNDDRVNRVIALFQIDTTQKQLNSLPDSVSNSFLNPIKVYSFVKKAIEINGRVKGHVLINSDTTITINSTAKLTDVIICAPAIIVNEGFQGNCQLFATDSVSIGKNCRLSYPSAIGIMAIKAATTKVPAKISISAGSVITGTVFSYEKVSSELKPVIDVDSHCKIIGQVYASGIFNYKKDVEIDGSIYANRFLYQTTYTRYENYLINMRINSSKLSRYYLTTDLVPASANAKQILQWLN